MFFLPSYVNLHFKNLAYFTLEPQMSLLLYKIESVKTYPGSIGLSSLLINFEFLKINSTCGTNALDSSQSNNLFKKSHAVVCYNFH